LRLNGEVIVSDVEAFMVAVERARAARGAAQVVAAEEAVALGVPELLPRARMERRGVANKRIELYRWLAEPHWERAGRRLEALGREAAGLLARAYRDAGRHAEALTVYAQLLGEDPLYRGAQEGLLAAAAGTGDLAQLHQAWQQVCACLEGEDDPELRAEYEELVREFERNGSNRPASGTRTAVGAVGR
jgi:tetratricopeptide (TPR) repeat protein